MLAAILTTVLALAPPPAQVQHSSSAPKGNYRAAVLLSTLENSPAWDDKADDPPVSARRAIALAEEVRAALVGADKEWTWHVDSISLELQLPKNPYWLVRFQCLPANGGIAGMQPFLLIPVTMDGVAVKPELIPDVVPKKRKRN